MEVFGAVGVLALTGLLTGLAPNPVAAPAPAAPSNVTATGSDFATTMKVTLTATPGTPGANRFDVDVSDYDSGAPLHVTSVSLRFLLVGRPDVAASDLALKPQGDAWTAEGDNLSVAGTWDVTATVQQGAKATEVHMSLSTRAPEQQVTISSEAPGQPTLYTFTLPGGQELQTYNDPGSAGTNQLHVTAFDTQGQELPAHRRERGRDPARRRPEVPPDHAVQQRSLPRAGGADRGHLALRRERDRPRRYRASSVLRPDDRTGMRCA